MPQPLPGLGAYQTAKFAVRGLSESLRISLATRGIGVSCLFAAGTRSQIVIDNVREERKDERRKLVSSWMDPIQVGAFVVEGIRNDAPDILTHDMGFRDKVGELYAMLDAAFPRSESDLPELAAFEVHRRDLIRQSRAMPVKD